MIVRKIKEWEKGFDLQSQIMGKGIFKIISQYYDICKIKE